MRRVKTGAKRYAAALVIAVLIAGLFAFPQISTGRSARSAAGVSGQGNDSPGRGAEQRADPCEHLPDPPGRAVGHDRRCPPPGSSGGVARGDFNGDGIGDLAVGVPNEDVGTVQDAGAVNVIYGSANGLTTTDVTVPPSQFWTQNTLGVLDTAEANDRFGRALAAGDFNGDGWSDLAIGIPGEVISGAPGTGAVHVLYGSANGLTAAGDELIANPLSETRSFGDSLVWADFDGDTVGDLAVEGQGTSGIGAVSVFYGSFIEGFFANGLLVRERQKFTFTNADVTVEGVGVIVNLSLAAGDFNGDQRDDLVVGTPLADVDTLIEPPIVLKSRDAGAVHVLYGAVGGLTVTGRQFLHQETFGVPDVADPNDQFGAALAVGDFNGDLFEDLAVGVPNEEFLSNASDVGAVNVIYGSGTGLRPSGQTSPPVPASQLWAQNIAAIPSEGGAEAGDHFGAALAANDFNGDGRADLAVGVPDEDINNNAISNAGAVNVIYGSNTGLRTNALVPPQIWHQNVSGINDGAEAGDRFGATLTAWNFGFQSKADLAVGVPGEDVPNSAGTNVQDAGAVNVIYGRFLIDVQLNPFVGLDAANDQFWHQGSGGVAGDGPEAGDRFGSALY